MESMVKIGVVGAGVFGGYHAMKCASHPRIDFMGIYDPNIERAQALTAKTKGQAFPTYQSLLNSVDAVIIASPAMQHGHMAIKALKARKHILVEKPIAHTLEDASHIVSLAEDHDCIVQVGHQERFVIRAIGLDKVAEKPIFIQAHRHSPFSERGTDVSVSLDLMTHDIDLVLWLMGDDPIDTQGQSMVIASERPDAAYAILKFPQGKAYLKASRVEPTSSRNMKLVYPSGTVNIDFNAKTLCHTTPFDLDENFGDSLQAKDSLGAATHAFVEAILDHKPVPITGGNGLRALKAALIIDSDHSPDKLI